MLWKIFSSFVLISSFIIINGSNGAKFPEDVKKCEHGSAECIQNTINYLLEKKSLEGHSGINLVKLDPLQINSINIKQGSESPVNIDLHFMKSTLTGLSTAKAYKISGFDKDLAGTHEIRMKCDSISLLGDYDVTGRVLILPISGSGKSNITLANPNMKLSFVGKPVTKNDKVYMQVENLRLSFTITRMYTNLENLFNGDKTLGDNMNLFLNENWEDIFNELKGAIFEAFGLIFQSVINNVFNKIPYDEAFSA